jgi:hypothetical protein
MEHLLKLKYGHRVSQARILASAIVPLLPLTVQMLNLALIKTKRNTLQVVPILVTRKT